MQDAPLEWIDSQRERMIDLLRAWSAINSGTRNLEGLARMSAAVRAELASFGGDVHERELPPDEQIDASGNTVAVPLGKLISLRKRPNAPIRLLLNIHYDTVYGADHLFQTTRLLDPDTLNGPGVLDAKGGLVVMLTAVRAFEQTELAERLGWEIVLNPDEEIGSPGSAPLLREAAARNHAALLFEPAMPDGNLAGARKGSGNFTAVIRGRAAHSGRDFASGRSAILAMTELIARVDAAQRGFAGVTINCGQVEGGGAVNVVPDLAIARFNARVTSADEQHQVEQRLAHAVEEVSKRDGISIALHGRFQSPPKVLDERSTRLMDLVIACGRELNLDLSHKPSGGACDGNRLAAAGLPVLDTLGPVGGELHSDREFVRLSSLVERAKLTTLLLMRLATGTGL